MYFHRSHEAIWLVGFVTYSQNKLKGRQGMCHLKRFDIHRQTDPAAQLTRACQPAYGQKPTGNPNIDGNLPKGPYPPCLRMADRALLAGYPRIIKSLGEWKHTAPRPHRAQFSLPCTTGNIVKCYANYFSLNCNETNILYKSVLGFVFNFLVTVVKNRRNYLIFRQGAVI